jgi:hypothetical protein
MKPQLVLPSIQSEERGAIIARRKQRLNRYVLAFAFFPLALTRVFLNRRVGVQTSTGDYGLAHRHNHCSV